MPNLFSYSGFNLSNNDGVAGYGINSLYNFANFLNGSSDSIGSFFGSLGSLVAAGGESNCSYDGSGSDEHLFHDFFCKYWDCFVYMLIFRLFGVIRSKSGAKVE